MQIKGAIDSIVNLFFSRLFDPDVDVCARWKGTQSADSQEKVLPRFFHVATFLLILFFVQLTEVCENLDLMKKSSENGIKKTLALSCIWDPELKCRGHALITSSSTN